jgi:hypothetical protein
MPRAVIVTLGEFTCRMYHKVVPGTFPGLKFSRQRLRGTTAVGARVVDSFCWAA